MTRVDRYRQLLDEKQRLDNEECAWLFDKSRVEDLQNVARNLSETHHAMRALEDEMSEAELDAIEAVVPPTLEFKKRVMLRRPEPGKIKVQDYFGGCPICGQNNGYYNVGPQHWFIVSSTRRNGASAPICSPVGNIRPRSSSDGTMSARVTALTRRSSRYPAKPCGRPILPSAPRNSSKLCRRNSPEEEGHDERNSQCAHQPADRLRQ